MISISIEKTSEFVLARLKGVLDGGVDFDGAIGPPPPRLVVDCAKITHVNSSAIRPWRTYFEKARAAGADLRFRECSPALIEYFNSVNGILCGGTVESVLACFYCGRCKSEKISSISTTDPQALREAISTKSCPNCKSPASLDDFPESYFAFLGKQFVSALSESTSV